MEGLIFSVVISKPANSTVFTSQKAIQDTVFIANLISCTSTELSKLSSACLTAIKKHVIKNCDKVYERSGKNLFWSFQNSIEVLRTEM